MKPVLTFPRHLLQQRLRELWLGQRPWLDCPAGLSWCSDGPLMEIVAARQPAPGGFIIRLSFAVGFAAPKPAEIPPTCVVLVQIGRERLSGRAGAWIKTGPDEWEPMRVLNLPGPGMHSVRLAIVSVDQTRNPEENSRDGELDADRWSRTIGALGAETYRRAAGLRIGFVGLGRLGSVLLRDQVRFGIRRLVVADPDKVEPHNVGEGAFELAEVGHLKVHAWENRLAVSSPQTEVIAVPDSVTHARAVEALKACDVLFSSPDQPGARLAAGAIAVAYARPLIDVGTQIHWAGPTTMGIDIRLVTPERCLLCCGGVRGEDVGRAFARVAGCRAEVHGGKRLASRTARFAIQPQPVGSFHRSTPPGGLCRWPDSRVSVVPPGVLSDRTHRDFLPGHPSAGRGVRLRLLTLRVGGCRAAQIHRRAETPSVSCRGDSPS